MFLLKPGLNRISVQVGPGFFTKYVGIVPLGRPSIISTSGFEWDVTEWATEFGTQISTSNHVKSIAETNEVEVVTTEAVLFTLEFADKGL